MYILNQIGESNPQLLRELKGRLTSVNIGIAAGVSLLAQIFIYLSYNSSLPEYDGPNRYCVNQQCFTDLLGKFVIIEKLWWLDLFISLTVIGLFSLLVLGTYLLVNDLNHEEKKGTLNFIRLSPASAPTIFLGKILGVPSLLYLGALIATPLHLFSGLQAGIPWFLLLSYYVVLCSGLFCCYSLAILFSLVTPKIAGFQPWLLSGIVLFLATSLGFSLSTPYYNPMGSVFDWLAIFYPGIVLNYLVKATFLAPDTIGYLDVDNIIDLQWYGKAVFSHPVTGISLILFNYTIWTYWAWMGIKRRFHNPLATVLSKHQSYWLSFSFILFGLGFTLQDSLWNDAGVNFAALQLSNLIFCLILIAILTPQRQTIQDWTRYRHLQLANKRNLFMDLLLGEKSPAVLAIAVNLAITTLYIIPCLFLFLEYPERISVLWGWLLSANLIVILAVIFQLILQWKNPKRSLWASSSLVLILVLPQLASFCFGIDGLWLFSPVPTLATKNAMGMTTMLACLTQWLGIVLLTGGMTYRLKKIGESETKTLTPAQN